VEEFVCTATVYEGDEMKCPNCEQEMKTVEVEYDSSPEVYVLDEETGRYVYQIYDSTDEPDDDTYRLVCGECGCELEGGVLDTFAGLIQTW